MRISDWSSYVCSSDLLGKHLVRIGPQPARDVGRIGAAINHAATEQQALVGGEAVIIEDITYILDAHIARHQAARALPAQSSEERRGGKEGGSTCRTRVVA